MTPTTAPTNLPSSMIPTQAPTITGSIVLIELSQLVTETMTESEIEDIVRTAEETYGVYPGNVEAEVTYDIAGVISLALDDDIPEEQIINAMTESIANSLNVHPSNVIIIMDPTTGDFVYEISSDTVEGASVLQDLLQSEDLVEELSSQVTQNLGTTADVDLDPSFGVTAVVELIVDSTNAENIDSSNEALYDQFNEEWNVVQESIFVTSVPTSTPSKLPSAEPTTLQPSAKPSITGLIVTFEVII